MIDRLQLTETAVSCIDTDRWQIPDSTAYAATGGQPTAAKRRPNRPYDMPKTHIEHRPPGGATAALRALAVARPVPQLPARCLFPSFFFFFAPRRSLRSSLPLFLALQCLLSFCLEIFSQALLFPSYFLFLVPSFAPSCFSRLLPHPRADYFVSSSNLLLER